MKNKINKKKYKINRTKKIKKSLNNRKTIKGGSYQNLLKGKNPSNLINKAKSVKDQIQKKVKSVKDQIQKKRYKIYYE